MLPQPILHRLVDVDRGWRDALTALADIFLGERHTTFANDSDDAAAVRG